MDSLARVTEDKFSLIPGTCKAFSLQESNHQPHAERVEYNYVSKGGRYADKVRSGALGYCRKRNFIPSLLTEIYQRGKSVTQFQIMFDNIRRMGYDRPFASEIKLHEAFEYFGQFVSKLRQRWPYTEDWIAAYNSGIPRKKNGQYINQRYIDNIMKHLKSFAE